MKHFYHTFNYLCFRFDRTMDVQLQQAKTNSPANSIQGDTVDAPMELNHLIKIKTEIEMEPESDMNDDVLGRICYPSDEAFNQKRISFPSDEAFNQRIFYPSDETFNGDTAVLSDTKPDGTERSEEITSNTDFNHEGETLEILELKAALDNGKQCLQVEEIDGIADTVELKQHAKELNKEDSMIPTTSDTIPKV